MLFVYEDPSDGARAGLEVLVRAPYGEISPPFVQRKRNVAHSMGKVKANWYAGLACDSACFCQRKELTCVVLNTGE